MKASSFVLLASAALLGGCLPIPHDMVMSPALEGTIVEGGKPVEGAQISFGRPLEGTDKCQEPSTTTTTADGRFVIPQRVEHFDWIFLFAEYFPPSDVCIATGGRPASTWKFGWVENEKSMTIDCDIQGEGGVLATRPVSDPGGLGCREVKAIIEPRD